MNIRTEIEAMIRQVAEEGGKELLSDLGDDTVLLRSGLDSLDFAIVVARLEDKLGSDPFSAMTQPVYPRTMAEFVSIYEQHFNKRA